MHYIAFGVEMRGAIMAPSWPRRLRRSVCANGPTVARILAHVAPGAARTARSASPACWRNGAPVPARRFFESLGENWGDRGVHGIGNLGKFG